jgi:hypothetical protein
MIRGFRKKYQVFLLSAVCSVDITTNYYYFEWSLYITPRHDIRAVHENLFSFTVVIIIYRILVMHVSVIQLEGETVKRVCSGCTVVQCILSSR